MPQRLYQLAQSVPVLPSNASLRAIMAAFEAAGKPDALLLARGGGGRPAGLVYRRDVAAAPRRRKDLPVRHGLPVLNGDLPADEALEEWVLEGADVAAPEVIVTRDGRPYGLLAGGRLARLMANLLKRMTMERDLARQEMKKAQDERLLFMANMGHELRTPLNAVIGYADMILSDQDGPGALQPYRRYIEAVHEGGHHLLSVINGMLDLAKVDARSMALHEEEIDLVALTEGALDMAQSIADGREVRLGFRVKTPLPSVLADPQLIRQILLNLLSNAIKFSPPGERVTVTLDRLRRGEVRLIVRDRGPGIAPEDIETVMQPFKQVDADGNRRALGTGLGLPLVRAFAELHEGRFQLMSAAGKGTRAIVTLPAGRALDARPGAQRAFAFTRKSIRLY